MGYNNSIGLPATAERHDGGRGDVHPVFTVEARKIPAEILAVMLEQGVHHVPIIDNEGTALGVVTDTDLLGLERTRPFT